MPFKMHKTRKKNVGLPYHKIFRPVTRNALILLFGLTDTIKQNKCQQNIFVYLKDRLLCCNDTALNYAFSTKNDHMG